MSETRTVAVTGASGTVGSALLPLLEEDPGVGRIIAIGSRERPAGALGAGKTSYRRADVRDRDAVFAALDGADAVVHLAFSIYGVRQGDETLREINRDGSMNVLDAAIAAGAARFVYTSSGIVYGVDSDRSPVTEDEPLAPDERHFYAAHKAEVEAALRAKLRSLPGLGWAILRPCLIVGPDAAGAAGNALSDRLTVATRAALSVAAGAGLRPFLPRPPVALQFVHARDVAQAVHRAAAEAAPTGIYNLGGEGMVEPADVAGLLGLRDLPLPGALTRPALGLAARLPMIAPALGWLRVWSQALELDSTRARRELGWQPKFTSAQALAATRTALGT